MSELKFIEQIIDEKSAMLIEANDKIWEYAELAFHETKSADLICDILEKEGITISDYIQREKIEVSCNLLKHSRRTIAEIAQYMGIQSQSNYAENFKKWKGQTPTEYRKENWSQVF